MKRQLHLNLFINSRGHHEASWRHPEASPLALSDIRYYRDLARRAEAGLFDSIFLADQLALNDDVERAGRVWLEPITALAVNSAFNTSAISVLLKPTSIMKGVNSRSANASPTLNRITRAMKATALGEPSSSRNGTTSDSFSVRGG